MAEASLRKRDREPEALPDYNDVQLPKRFHGEEKDQFPHLQQFQETLADDDDQEFAPIEEQLVNGFLETLADDDDQEFAPIEEQLVNGFVRSLEEEIAPKSCSSYYSNNGDISPVSSISRGREGQTVASESGFDLRYLLDASDDELGIPPIPVVDLKDEVCVSTTETSEGLLDLKSLSENWHFEHDFESYQQIAVHEYPWNVNQLHDFTSIDFLSQSMLIDGDFSAAWRLETASGV